MIVTAIDPGSEQSAILVWDGLEIKSAEIIPNATALRAIRDMNPSLENVMAIEMIASYGMPVGKTVFETVLWIGRFAEAYSNATCKEPMLIYRRDIKMHHCQSVRAKDTNVRQALIDKFGVPGTKKQMGVTYGLKKDLWSAFGLATYVIDDLKIPSLASSIPDNCNTE